MFKEKGILAIGIIISLLFVGYGILKSLPYLEGPKVTIYSPKAGDHVGSSTFILSGQALRTKELYLSGKSVSIDTDGKFSETFVSRTPYTILTIEAVDKHKKRALQTLIVTP